MIKKMKVGMMVTGHFTIPPPEKIIYAPMIIAKAIGEGLSQRGHKIYFFAPEGSKLKVTKIISGGLKPLHGISGKEDLKILSGPEVGGGEMGKIFNLWDQYLISLIYQKAIEKKLDLIHVHPVDRALPFGLAFKKIPIIYTLHDPVYPWRRDIFRLFKSKNQYYVSISDAQRKPAPDLNWAATVYNGLDLEIFPYSEKPKNQFLFLGRLLPTKGVAEAITAARKANVSLIIAGTPNKGSYWERKIKPFLGKNIKYVGNVPYEETHKYYGQARALLCPIQWEEPFGLTFIEAMACGTPVIAFNKGSASEVVKDKKTGFIVNSIGGMVKAIKNIDQIKREDCRAWVKQNFSLERMISNYEKVFLKILKKEHGKFNSQRRKKD
jgi:glycosyltransferase involved in cell wall biosynthesis